MFFTPIDIFTYVVIITLIILILSQIILWMVCIPFADIPISVTCLRVNIRRRGLSPQFPAAASTVGFLPRNLSIRMCYQTFNVFIFTRFVSTIHLSFSASWVTMRSLALFFKVNSSFLCDLCSWGSPRFFQSLDGWLGYLLELLEVPIALQLIHLAREFSIDFTFRNQATKACFNIHIVDGGSRPFRDFGFPHRSLKTELSRIPVFTYNT